MINVGIIGFGTVGTGTAKILLGNKDVISQRTGFDINLKKIADLDIKKSRGLKLPEGILTTNADDILNDPEINIVIELIGGIHPAKDFILKAIRNKKHVVTANKALIATEGNEILAEAEKHGVEIGFEASVAGGIPIIKIIKEGLVANRILAVYGIINGTSNYILTKMTDEGIEFSDALKDAQRLGYAEADPTYDIEGIDSAHKLAILASLAYDIPLSFNDVYKEGITRITSQDIGFAGELGYKIKLLAIAKATDNKVELRVHPTMVPKDYLISKVDGVFNAIYVQGDAVGDTLYYGRGAGDMPTGSAVVSDVVDIGKRITMQDSRCRIQDKKYHASSIKIKKMEEIEAMYYFRFTAFDKPGVLSNISGVLGSYNISITSVIQKGRRLGEAVPLIVLTHTAKEKDVIKAVAEIDRLSVVADKTLYIRVEGKEE
ncbi:MAG: homoserine dehydrogenase [Nitrospirae bacterium GWF2_44_13]|nr:MAG: homoserine dehydrogenase [Nitrospirae bacterium GWF2_44_13]OGW35244.1 MAG: homoserine dehydrogenase [Nitrospirae bacterium GWD2_44_7]OGW64323.1 MAG: homoserine dehydrogenase [Nitrospirae bacterium RIFOXYA2_FULL_44_9]OGW70897.1 MAG: homoserine dehydrogenase [Nitrospirae bacterium RIFOXYC2_FULL_44_7]HBG93330.1 homoserine dehydrogenase [Nitrospiraceae bacterium]